MQSICKIGQTKKKRLASMTTELVFEILVVKDKSRATSEKGEKEPSQMAWAIYMHQQGMSRIYESLQGLHRCRHRPHRFAPVPPLLL
jgi:hypothetical protein